MDVTELAKPFELSPDAPRRWTLGPLTLWLRREQDEVLVAVIRADEDTGPAETATDQPPPETDPQGDALTWSRWIVAADPCLLRLSPRLPDRAVVARPNQELVLPVGQTAELRISIPVWVALETTGPNSQLLGEFPTRVLSNTWFGTPTDGELSYSLATRARRPHTAGDLPPHRAQCPVTVHNVASDPLNIERLSVHADELTCYGSGQGLWTTAVDITFRGEDEVSRVELADGPPATARDAHLLGDPRTDRDTGLLRRSFTNLKNFTGG
ncbi:MAG: hypothetical protein R3336_09660 [Phycisphaeraceae bacterium]|nr:hypothetical protein [Phycisphaeraceae bacterium]